MIVSYLKYYFGHDGNKLFCDSVVCEENTTPVEPHHFLKWYMEGDLTSLSENENKDMLKSESPIFSAVFAPRTVTFSVEEVLLRRQK